MQPVESFGRSYPQAAVRILDDRIHAIVGETVSGRQARHLRAGPAANPAMRANPHVAATVLEQRFDDVVDESPGGCEGPERASVQTTDSPGLRAHPEASISVAGERVHHFVGLRASAGPPVIPAVPHARDPTARSTDPETPVGVFGDRGDAMGRTSFSRRDQPEPAVVEQAETAGGDTCLVHLAAHDTNP